MSTLGGSHYQISKLPATGSLSASNSRLRIPDKDNFDASVSFHPQTLSSSKPSLTLGLEISLRPQLAQILYHGLPCKLAHIHPNMLETDNFNHSV